MVTTTYRRGSIDEPHLIQVTLHRTHPSGVVPKPGQVWRHSAMSIEAEFRQWRRQPDYVGGRWMMVLYSPRYGECVWYPQDAELAV